MNFNELERIPIKDDSNLKFPNGLFGFEKNRRFALVAVDEMKPFQWLVGVDEPGITFMMIDPYLVDQDDGLELDRETPAQVKATAPEEVVASDRDPAHERTQHDRQSQGPAGVGPVGPYRRTDLSARCSLRYPSPDRPYERGPCHGLIGHRSMIASRSPLA